MIPWYNSLFPFPLDFYESGKKTQSALTARKNRLIFQDTFARLVQDAMNRYHIEGLPETCNERVTLMSLLWHGSVILFEKEGNLISLPGVPDGSGFNIYGDPGSGWVYAANGFNEHIDLYLPGTDESTFLNKLIVGKGSSNPKGVLVRENALCYPFIRTVIFYADCISDSMRMLDVARQNIKQPFVITAEESVVNSVRKFFKDRNSNEELIVSTGVFPADKINLLPFDTNADNLANAIQLVDWYENKFRELCGVDSNGQIDKKGENLIQAELSINDEQQENNLDKCLKYIQDGLDNANKLFSLNMKVIANQGKENEDEPDDILGDGTGDTEPVS